MLSRLPKTTLNETRSLSATPPRTPARAEVGTEETSGFEHVLASLFALARPHSVSRRLRPTVDSTFLGNPPRPSSANANQSYTGLDSIVVRTAGENIEPVGPTKGTYVGGSRLVNAKTALDSSAATARLTASGSKSQTVEEPQPRSSETQGASGGPDLKTVVSPPRSKRIHAATNSPDHASKRTPVESQTASNRPSLPGSSNTENVESDEQSGSVRQSDTNPAWRPAQLRPVKALEQLSVSPFATKRTDMTIDSVGSISVQPELVEGEVKLSVDVSAEEAKEWLQRRLRSLGLGPKELNIKVRRVDSVTLQGPQSAIGEKELPQLQALHRLKEIYSEARRDFSNFMGSNFEKDGLGGRGAGTEAMASGIKSENEPSGTTNSAKSAGADKSADAEQNPFQMKATKEKLGESGVAKLPEEGLASRKSDPQVNVNANPTTNSSPLAQVAAGKLGVQVLDRGHLPEMIQKIVEMTNSHTSLSSQKLEAQLDVERVGTLLVDAVKRQGKINLQINVENAEVRRLIETQLRPMIEQMTKEGIELGKLEVSVRDPKQEGQQDNDFEQNSGNPFEERQPRQTLDWASSERQSLNPVQKRSFGYNSMEVWA